MSDNDEALQVAQEQLYENEGLRRHLTDDQAGPLLAWAAERLAASGAKLEQAQEQVGAVLQLIDQAAARDDAGERQRLLGRLPTLLQELPAGGPPPPVPEALLPGTTASSISLQQPAGAAPPAPVPEAAPPGTPAPAVLPQQPAGDAPPPPTANPPGPATPDNRAGAATGQFTAQAVTGLLPAPATGASAAQAPPAGPAPTDAPPPPRSAGGDSQAGVPPAAPAAQARRRTKTRPARPRWTTPNRRWRRGGSPVAPPPAPPDDGDQTK